MPCSYLTRQASSSVVCLVCVSHARLQVLVDQWREFEKGIRSLEAWIPSALDRVQKLVKINPAEVETAELLTRKSALLLVRNASVVILCSFV